MANVKVEAQQTMAGKYGRALAGDVVVVNEKDAKLMEKAGIAKIVGEAAEGDVETRAEKGSVRFNDNTGKEKVQREEKEDPSDPTNEAKNKEKVTPAGPGAKRKSK